MLSRYHIEITKRSLEAFFSPTSLREILCANIRQDSLPSLFGVEARRHVCDCRVVESLAYIDEEHAQIAHLAHTPGGGAAQRAALGRLLHTVQDLYAHTNYVALWQAENTKVMPHVSPQSGGGVLDGLDPRILTHPDLQVAQWLTWREPLYYIPLVGRLLRHFWLPTGSHEAINLDSPQRGVYFFLAVAIARQRTLAEYARAVAAIREVGGHEAIARFHGTVGYAPHASPAEA